MSIDNRACRTLSADKFFSTEERFFVVFKGKRSHEETAQRSIPEIRATGKKFCFQTIYGATTAIIWAS
jgi:hypothetical protein